MFFIQTFRWASLLLIVGGAVAAITPSVSVAQSNFLDQVLQKKFQQVLDPSSSGGETVLSSPLDSSRQRGEQQFRSSNYPASTFIRQTPSRLESDYTSRIRAILGTKMDDSIIGAPPTPEASSPLRIQSEQSEEHKWLPQFGYDVFQNPSPNSGALSTGSINDQYHLGIGDEIIVTFRGQKNLTYRTRVDRVGRIVLPEYPPVLASGRSYGEFRTDLENITKATFPQTEIFVSLGAVRNIGVYVLGEVTTPGIQRLSGLSTVIDAIVTAGGIKKTGTLRSVELIRNNKRQKVDLYDLLLTGSASIDLTLMEGDRIFVPSLGPTISIVGEVSRPGIYELKGAKGRINALKAIKLAGGTLRPAGYRYLRVQPNKSGEDRLQTLPAPKKSMLSNGNILMVLKSAEIQAGGFSVEGHVAVPGIRSLERFPTAGSLLRDRNLFKENPYLLFAALQTTDVRTRARFFIPLNLTAIQDGRSRIRFKQNDRLIVFSLKDIKYLSSADVQAVLDQRRPPSFLRQREAQALSSGMVQGDNARPQDPQLVGQTGRFRQAQSQTSTIQPIRSPSLTSNDDFGQAGLCGGLHALSAVVQGSQVGRFSNAYLGEKEFDKNKIQNIQSCPDIFDQFPELLSFVMDFSVSLLGISRRSGVFPIASNTPLSDLVAVSGGFGRHADLNAIEITRFTPADVNDSNSIQRKIINTSRTQLTSVALMPGDIVRINAKFTARDSGPVIVEGEVRRPGRYTIHRGERLSEVLARAGGLTKESYAIGTVFSRLSVRNQEGKAFQIAANDIETSLATALANPNADGRQQGLMVSSVEKMINTLRNTIPVGRVVVEADPAILEVHPELDTILTPGDRIIIPKRPNHVYVGGEVLHPGAQQFRSSINSEEYISMAGGIKFSADDDRIYAILPNGQAKPIASSSWNFSPMRLPPGSAIIVPVDPSPFDLITFSKDVLEIVSKAAITAASIIVISDR